jgi:hypothetical protein
MDCRAVRVTDEYGGTTCRGGGGVPAVGDGSVGGDRRQQAEVKVAHMGTWLQLPAR